MTDSPHRDPLAAAHECIASRGVPRAMVKERMRMPETLTLPSDADPALKPKLDACLANRPKGTPPARSS